MQNRLMQLRSSNSVNILPNSYYLPSTASYPWPQLLRSSARPRDWCNPQRQASEIIYYARFTEIAPVFIIYEEPARPPVEGGPFEAFWNRVLEFITKLITYTTRSFGPPGGTARGRAPLRDLRLRKN
ncbi:uncharacterized protein LAJ45_01620 [Morchella importuna]|uniref:uncharacterized protein n=1 Tax=Morchella importuna TaxID=1174673 RepID=UPI001E8CAF4B|nr:uncharacterized protein LAJ45_01620 [Morchella importuna]KAH8153853.1 hypothetical protein LAJ45_01620 [Morchella importuna]